MSTWQTDPNLVALLSSKRFWAAVSAIAVLILHKWFPSISSDNVYQFTMIAGAWIVGETFRPVNGQPATIKDDTANQP